MWVLVCDRVNEAKIFTHALNQSVTHISSTHVYGHTDLDYRNAPYNVHLDSDAQHSDRPLEMSFNLSDYQWHFIALQRDHYPQLNIFQTVYLRTN